MIRTPGGEHRPIRRGIRRPTEARDRLGDRDEREGPREDRLRPHRLSLAHETLVTVRL